VVLRFFWRAHPTHVCPFHSFSGERDFPSGRHWATGRTPRERSDGIVWKFKKSPVSPGGDVTAFINLCAVSATFVYIFGIRRTRSKIVTHHLHLFFMLRPTHSAGSVRAYHTLRMTVVRSDTRRDALLRRNFQLMRTVNSINSHHCGYGLHFELACNSKPRYRV
jgi:hypothetical protein